MAASPAEPSDELRDEIRWLYRHGATYDDNRECYGDQIDNATLAQVLDGVHVNEPHGMPHSVRTLLAYRQAGRISTNAR
jgi:hypothetical protein